MSDDPSLYEALFGAYPDALLLVDAGGRIVLSNPMADTLFGYASGELIGQNVDVLVPDGIRPVHAQHRRAYGEAPRARPMGTQMDLSAKRRDGSEVMVEIALSPLPRDHRPYVVVAVRGIGAYPRVKQALQRARYSEHVARMGRLAVDTRDPQALLQKVTEVAAEALEADTAVLFLLEPDRLALRVTAGVALLPHEGIGARVANRPDQSIGRLLSTGVPLVVDDYASDTRISVPPEVLRANLRSGLSVPLFDRGQVIGVLTARSRESRRFGAQEVHLLESLSNLLAATLQRLQTEEQLSHSQRLESVGQLTGGIAHDFNNLLTVIQGNLQVLEEMPEIGNDPRLQPLVSAASRATRRGAELTRNLLVFSRRQVLSPTRIDVPALLHALADMLRRTLDQRIRIEVETAPRCPPCLADPAQLESALLNIAINARDAMAGGGCLRFACRPAPHLPDDAAQETGSADGYVAIEIADDGGGMPAAIRERAFEPFFTTKESGRGTGLGLSTVYGFAKQSRGAVTLHSELGVGTTVTLYIPIDRTRRDGDDEGDAAPAPLRAGLRVMLVEDEADVRAVALRLLDRLGCVTTAFAQAEPALEALRRSGDGPCDLLVSDVALGPGMRGTELAREAARLQPAMGIVLVSGFSEELLELDRTVPSSWELLSKPYSLESLRQAMARALA